MRYFGKQPLHHLAACTAVCAFLGAQPALGQEYLSGIRWEAPPVVTPGVTNAAPPSDAIVLFDGTDLSQDRKSVV